MFDKVPIANRGEIALRIRRAGRLAGVPVEDGQPVEFGQPLILIECEPDPKLCAARSSAVEDRC